MQSELRKEVGNQSLTLEQRKNPDVKHQDFFTFSFFS